MLKSFQVEILELKRFAFVQISALSRSSIRDPQFENPPWRSESNQKIEL